MEGPFYLPLGDLTFSPTFGRAEPNGGFRIFQTFGGRQQQGFQQGRGGDLLIPHSPARKVPPVDSPHQFFIPLTK